MAGGRIRNRVLRRLAAGDPETFEKVLGDIEPAPLHRRAELAALDESSAWIYFVESGVISLVGEARNGASVEVALVGYDGVVGIGDVLGSRAVPYRLEVQIEGMAYRARADMIRDHVFTCRALHDPLLEYTQALIAQLAQSVVCSRFHTAVERLARWLLLTAERAETARLPLTHETLAHMVGAPRSAVTAAAAALREEGVVQYTRGLIEVRNMARLKKHACECYGVLSLQGTDGTARGRKRVDGPRAQR